MIGGAARLIAGLLRSLWRGLLLLADPSEPHVRRFTADEAARLQEILDAHGLNGEAIVASAIADEMSEADVTLTLKALIEEMDRTGLDDEGHVTSRGEQLERLADLIVDRERPASDSP